MGQRAPSTLFSLQLSMESKNQDLGSIAGADPGFLVGGDTNIPICQISPQKCMKLRKVWPGRGAPGQPPWMGHCIVPLSTTVADPGFSPGGRQLPKSAIIFQVFAENCMKMKEFGPPGGARVPGAPPWIRQCTIKVSSLVSRLDCHAYRNAPAKHSQLHDRSAFRYMEQKNVLKPWIGSIGSILHKFAMGLFSGADPGFLRSKKLREVMFSVVSVRQLFCHVGGSHVCGYYP